jgi:hypothetical protein
VRRRARTILWTALSSIAGTVLVVALFRNLTSGEKKIEFEIPTLYGTDSPQLVRVFGHLMGPAIEGGNRVQPLQNGDEIFPAMLAAIRGARKTICFETYIYWRGQIAREFSDALSERARAGVKVHVLLDWLGSKFDAKLIEEMARSGIEVERYHPIRWYQMNRLNHRTHRKLLVVDGRIGFTGGVGIGDQWLGHAQDSEHWRDSHYRVEGPVVAQMQAAFMDNWLNTRARVLHGEEYFPPLEPVGHMSAQMFRSSPREGSDSIRLMYLLAIAAARHEILLGGAASHAAWRCCSSGSSAWRYSPRPRSSWRLPSSNRSSLCCTISTPWASTSSSAYGRPRLSSRECSPKYSSCRTHHESRPGCGSHFCGVRSPSARWQPLSSLSRLYSTFYTTAGRRTRALALAPGRRPVAEQAAQRDHLPEVIGVVVGGQDRLAQQRVLPLAVRQRLEQVGARIGDQPHHGLQIGAETGDGAVPGPGVGRLRAAGRPVPFRPARRDVRRVAAELEDVPLRQAQVLEQLPQRVLDAVGPGAAQRRRHVADDRFEAEVGVLAGQHLPQLLAQRGVLILR